MNLAEISGHPISATQVERWRRRGLLPRSTPQYLGKHGTRRIYPPGTGELVCSLARHTAPGRSLADVALLAFFDRAPIPEDAVKWALADEYFTTGFKREAKETAVVSNVPVDMLISPE